MSEDKPDTTLFFNLQTIEHDLRNLPKSGPPIIRPLTINPRMKVKKWRFLELIHEITYDMVITKIGWSFADRDAWITACFDPNTKAHDLAKAVFRQTIYVIHERMKNMIELEEELKKQKSLTYRQKRYKGVILDKNTK